MTTLVVVESAGKTKTIQSYLGAGHIVLASGGIFQDLHPKKLSINIDNNFEPEYIITKPDIVNKLKLAMANATMLYIASDADREGERIGESIKDILKPKQYKRLIFRSIDKKSVLEAVSHAVDLNYDMINAQRGRRVVDKLFGWLVSPSLSKQVIGGVSAGRVQTPTLRLIVDKENEINDFINSNNNSSCFKLRGTFSGLKTTMFQITKPNKIAQIALPDKNVTKLLNQFLKSVFTVHSISNKITTRKPSPPFSTSSMQQESYRKFGISIEHTMSYAQKLYEAGYITYMRTDSIEIPDNKRNEIKDVIIKEYGIKYYQENIYKNKIANAQEAHSAILCVHPELMDITVDDPNQIKLYKLIWQRMIASQMKDAKIDVLTVQINISKNKSYYFQGQVEKIIFYGFMKVYVESMDDAVENDIMTDYQGTIKEDQVINMEEINAKQEFLRPPCRYSEASIVKTLENKGIGRPATFVNVVKKNLERKYINISNIPGTKKQIKVFSIKSKKGKHIMNIEEESLEVLIGNEKNKLIPTEIGINVIKFMEHHFLEFIEYNFTAKMETDLDKIANGKKKWQDVVRIFYEKLNPVVIELSKLSSIAKNNERIIGMHSNSTISASVGKYGPYLKHHINGKNVYTKIPPSYDIESINLNEAIQLIETPKDIKQEYKINGGIAVVLNGQYGHYIRYNKGKTSKNYKIAKDVDINGLTKESIGTIINSYKKLKS